MKNLIALVVVLGFLASTAGAQVSPFNQGATVWFYRPADSPLPEDIPTLHEVGGLTRPLGRPAPGEFFGYSVSPGVHVFSYTKAPARGQAISVLVKQGEQAYVEVQFRDLKQVTPDKGAAAVRRLRPLPDGNVLDKSVVFSPPASASLTTPSTVPSPIRSAGPVPPPPTMTIVTWPTVAPASSRNASSQATTSALANTAGRAAPPAAVGPPPATALASTGVSPAAEIRSTLQEASTPSITISSPATVMGPLPGAASAPNTTASRTTASDAPSAPPPSSSTVGPQANASPSTAASLSLVSATGSPVPPVTAAPDSEVTKSITPASTPSTPPATTTATTQPEPMPKDSAPPSAASVSSSAALSPALPTPPATTTPDAPPLPPVTSAGPDRNTSTATPEPSSSSTTETAQPASNPPPLPEPASLADVFSGATLIDGKKQEVDVFVAFDHDALLVLDKDGVVTLKSLPYANITMAEYTFSSLARWKVVVAGTPAVSSAGGNRHWFMVQTHDDYALMNLDADNYQSAIAAFESRIGRKVGAAETR